MSWTVPTGCYYAGLGERESKSFTYYSAGEVVPSERSPYNLTYGTILGIRFILVDFINCYIYTNAISSETRQIEINIDTTNQTFTATARWSDSVAVSKQAVVDIIGGNECVSRLNFSLTGDQFNFGNGTGLMEKSELLGGSSIPYAMRHTFRSRTDITSGVIATGAEWLYYTFCDCNNLQSVSQQTIPTIQCAIGVFYRCTSLTTAPSFSSVVANGTANYSNPNWGANIYARYTSCFYGCSSLTTAPTIPNGITHLLSCFYGCSSLTTAPELPASVTHINNCFNDCQLLIGNITVYNTITESAQAFKNTNNNIYIINGAGTSAVESSWRSVSSGYANVHYEADDNTAPSVSMSVTRVDSALSEVQTPMGEYAYINAQVQLYEDYLPVGWSNSLPNPNSSGSTTVITKDGTTQTVTWTDTDVGLLYSLKCWINLGDIVKHTFTLQTADKIIDDNNTQKASHLSAIATQILSKSYKLVDYYHESDQTDPNYDTEGFAIGKYATQANLFDVDMPALFRDTTTCKDMTPQEVDDFVDGLNVSGGDDTGVKTLTAGITYRRRNGIVFVDAYIGNGTTVSTTYQTLATLPVGFRPYDTIYEVMGTNSVNCGVAYVTSSGTIGAKTFSGSTRYYWFHFQFIADN